MKKITKLLFTAPIIVLTTLLLILTTADQLYSQCTESCSGTNVFFGINAGAMNSTGSSNSFFGRLAGEKNTTGFANSFFGRDAGAANIGGSGNCFFGAETGQNNTSGVNNSYYGEDAGTNSTTGSFNSLFGHNAGRKLVTGSANTFLGYRAGYEILGSSNICIGDSSGPILGNGNINNRLFIDIKPGGEPLIYGEFDNDFVKINGTFEVKGGLMNPSSREIKTQFSHLDPGLVLHKLVDMDIEEWSYSEDPEIRHVGPTAEDFYESFGLGSTNKSISTIDADGISLIAIKGLYDELTSLKNENEILKAENQKYKNLIGDLDRRLLAIESSISGNK